MPPLLPTPPRQPRHAYPGAVMRMVIALLVAVALPAQAISASMERAWNAAHYHLNDSEGAGALAVADTTMDTRQNTIGEHYPLQRARGMSLTQQDTPAAQALENAPRLVGLDTHTAAHRAGVAHHHDASTQGVVYVADAGEQPLAAARSGKHDHDGFSPAVPSLRTSDAQFHDHDPALIASTPSVSHVSSPGERPPR